jgi:hypothetical protein
VRTSLRCTSKIPDGVSPAAARALTCQAVRAGASALLIVICRQCCLVALAAARTVWQPSGALSRERPHPAHNHVLVFLLLELVGRRVARREV